MPKIKSELKKLNNYLSYRERCDTSCKYVAFCPLRGLSELEEDKRCMLKTDATESMRITFIDLFMRGEDGLVNEIKRALFLYKMTGDLTKPKELKEYVSNLLSLRKQVYGNEVPAEDKNLKVEVSMVGHKDTVAEVETPDDPESLFTREPARVVDGKVVGGESAAERIIKGVK